MPSPDDELTDLTGDDTLPETIDEHILRGSINTRLNFSNAVFGGLSTTEDDTVAEIGWFGLGNQYDVRDFHRVVLNNGAVPLNILEQLVDQYIKDKKA